MQSVSDPATESHPPSRRARRAAQAPVSAPLPDIPHAPFRPLVTGGVLAGCLLLALSAYAGPVLVAVTVAAAGCIVAWGWAGLLGLPSPRGTTTVLGLGVAAIVASVAFVQDDPFLRWLPAGVAFSMIAAFAHQLARRDGRPRLVESVASTVCALSIFASGASLVPLPHTYGGQHVVAAASAAVAASALTDLAGHWERLRHWLLPLAMFGGALVAILVAAVSGQLAWGPAALLGVVAAGVSHAIRRLLCHLPTIAGARPQLVVAAASLLTTGVVVYVVSRIFVA